MFNEEFYDAARSVLNPPTPLQGQLVDYWVDPETAIGNEPREWQTGMVMTDDDFNAGGTNSCLLCPLIPATDSINEILGIAAPDNKGFFRPDMATHIGIAYMEPSQQAETNIVFAKSFVKKINDKFLKQIGSTAIIAPAKSFIRKNDFAYFEAIPYPETTSDTGDAPALNLTPALVTAKTGLALVCRGFTRFERYDPRAHTSLPLLPGFSPTFVNATNLVTVSVNRLQHESRFRPQLVGAKIINELTRKIHAQLDAAVYEQVKAEYPGKVGEYPQYIRDALMQKLASPGW